MGARDALGDGQNLKNKEFGQPVRQIFLRPLGSTVFRITFFISLALGLPFQALGLPRLVGLLCTKAKCLKISEQTSKSDSKKTNIFFNKCRI